ncbi:hypothetical protein G7007_02405 [Pseudomonas entomophila]|uniref:hypothetical protein n=1 Tax=Pseudomonas entomophila TaxID=312306 RepID=UPI0015E30E69|nr:hypothetical protein [Pseudomonas entomophila]MBA1191716.1 hypothetical protein [Pseudomonas entomophila]
MTPIISMPDIGLTPYRGTLMAYQVDKTALNHLIGTPYIDSVKCYIRELTGLPLVIGPKDPSTKDCRTDRVFIVVDEGMITGFRFN